MASRQRLADHAGAKGALYGFGGKAGGGGEVSTTITDAHRETWKAVFSQRIPGGPTERGFDEYFGTDVPNWPPYCFIDGDRTVGIPSELLPASKLVKNQASKQGPALPDWQLEGILPALADRAEKFIQDCSQRRRSRFCSTCRSPRRTRRWP
jgi:arylsulfatase A